MVLPLLLAACAPQSYVADIHYDGGGLVATKCAFDAGGQATRWCHDEPIDAPEPYTGTPDPAEFRRVERALAHRAPPRPAPSDAELASALNAPGVRSAMEACRAAYAPSVTALDVWLTVARTGELTELSTDAPSGKFAACADRALRTSNLRAFDGTQVVRSHQLIAL